MKKFLSKFLIVVIVLVVSLAANVGIMAVTGTSLSMTELSAQTPIISRAAFTPKAYTISMKITGQKMGLIGSNTRILSVSHSIVSPRDVSSGLPTGQRMHHPFVITKELDRISPLLENVLCTNENLPEVLITFSDGNPKDTYTIRLTNANIASIDLSGGTDTNGQISEEIAFTYQGIEWTSVADGTSAIDDWEAMQP